MNYDRLLTRVWDKQEKKMLYPSKVAVPKSLVLIENEYRTFRGVTATSLIITYYCGITYNLVYIPFGDRFVPMQCLGNTDKNKKLIYSADIIATSNNKYLVYREEESAAFWFKRLDNECEILINDFGCEIEIIGNKWENEDLFNEIKKT